MKLKPIALAAALTWWAAASWAPFPTRADPPATPATVTATPPPTATVANSQQNRMKQCQADATSQGLKSADRQTYVNSCLKAKPPAVLNSQQQKMKSCQADATAQGLQGADRTAYLNLCLKSH